MRLKALLLGSATAIAVAGGAQAADLSVAEPVDYVKVCDAFGTGYWYIPGTDTCLKLSGFVGFQITGAGEQEGPFGNTLWEDHYNFYTEAYLNISAKSMTDWGPLEGFLAFYAGNDEGTGGWNLDEAYISIGPLLMGYTQSGFSQWNLGAAGIWQSDAAQSGWFKGDPKTNLVRLTWAMNGFGLLVELDEPHYWDRSYYGSSMPDIIAALTASNAMFDGKISFVYSDLSGGWAVSAGVTVKLDSIAPGDKLLLQAAYGQDAPVYVLGYAGSKYSGSRYIDYVWEGTSAWSAGAAFQHYFAPNFYASIAAFYGHWENWADHSQWQAAFDLGYSPAPNLWIVPGIRYWSEVQNSGSWGNSYWEAGVRIRRNF
jgi:hypothetical protein